MRVLRRGNFTGDDETAIGSHDDATGVLGYMAQGRATTVYRRAHRISTAAYTVRWPNLFMAGVIHSEDICVTLSAICQGP